MVTWVMKYGVKYVVFAVCSEACNEVLKTMPSSQQTKKEEKQFIM